MSKTDTDTEKEKEGDTEKKKIDTVKETKDTEKS